MIDSSSIYWCPFCGTDIRDEIHEEFCRVTMEAWEPKGLQYFVAPDAEEHE